MHTSERRVAKCVLDDLEPVLLVIQGQVLNLQDQRVDVLHDGVSSDPYDGLKVVVNAVRWNLDLVFPCRIDQARSSIAIN